MDMNSEAFPTSLGPTILPDYIGNSSHCSLLKLDYEDFLRQRHLRLWDRDDPRRSELIALRCTTVESVAAWVGEIHGRDRRSGLIAAGAEISDQSGMSNVHQVQLL